MTTTWTSRWTTTGVAVGPGVGVTTTSRCTTMGVAVGAGETTAGAAGAEEGAYCHHSYNYDAHGGGNQ